MGESFLINLRGGNQPSPIAVGEEHYPWPLPGIIPAIGGSYVKVSESDLPPQQPGSGLVRGAIYEWRPDPNEER